MTLMSTEAMRANAKVQCPFTADIDNIERLCNQYADHDGNHTFNGTPVQYTQGGRKAAKARGRKSTVQGKRTSK